MLEVVNGTFQMNKCKECNGSGVDNNNADCLSCHSTGDRDFEPFNQCQKCYKLASAYPPYKCEYGCDDDK